MPVKIDKVKAEKIQTASTLEKDLSALQDYLSSTDWYAIRLADTGEMIPEEVKKKAVSSPLTDQ